MAAAGCHGLVSAQHGTTLIELMVALLLGAILSGVMLTAYLGAQRDAVYASQLARLHENGRYAMHILSRELMMAGFFGGVRNMAAVPLASVGADCSDAYWVLDGVRSLELVDDYTGEAVPQSTHGTSLVCVDSEEVVFDTDIISIKRTAGEPSLQDGKLAANMIAAATDTWYLHVVEGEAQTWQKIAPLALHQSAQLQRSESFWEAATKIFFIRPYSDSANTDDTTPTLCMKILVGDGITTRCLVEGIENMQIEFGIDRNADGAPDQYLAAPTAADMPLTVVAKVYLLVRSVQQVRGWRDSKTYFLGQKKLPSVNDHYLREVFSATLLLRNQGIGWEG